MDTARYYLLCFACFVLTTSGAIYGTKFLKKRNYLLAAEWFIVAISATNFLVYFLTEWPPLYHIAHFFDAFTRAFGVPVIGVLGFMTVTHDFKPSARQDVALFVLAFGGAMVLEMVDVLAPALPYFYVAMWTGLSIYVVYFIKRLLSAGERFHAMTMIVALVTSQVIACIYDFYKIPGEEHNVVFNFYFMALLTWAYFIAASHYAYCALERKRSGLTMWRGAVPSRS
ncbi:hypothetical protein [Burkholderia aenigmatica]|uniref:Uncharacterized protein n=1 Tax=Burkholderia aenigmatica TaxID=2015348 RepID=A0A228HTM4_9BURK|nr:hypothetical protein [Burkholderia aenigmatica]OXI33543.1 hypothetical protein CFB84_38070 [Burkholderia aenigmatica]